MDIRASREKMTIGNNRFITLSTILANVKKNGVEALVLDYLKLGTFLSLIRPHINKQ